MKQKQIVYEIVKQAGSQGIRSEQVKIQAMYKGVSDAGRYLRWLKNEKPLPKVYCERKEGDKTYTWRINTIDLRSGMIAHLNSKTGKISDPPRHNNFYDLTKKILTKKPEKLLSMATIQASHEQLDLILK